MSEKTPSVLKRLAGALGHANTASLMTWQPEGASYPRLMSFDAGLLAGRAGVYLLWHLGVRPQWLRVGFTKDLGAAAAHLTKTPELADFIPHDGPFLSWSFCLPETAPGFVNFLTRRLHPVLQDLVLTCDMLIDPAAPPIPCPLPAGTKDIQRH